jgi:hypothetical protein
MSDQPNPEAEYGFKIPDASNVLEPDPLSKAFSTLDEHGTRSFVPEDILRALAPARLESHVPHEVRRAFRVALGSLPYAYWYYPLYTMGSQQLLRVADYALDQFARTAGMERPYSMADRIQKLSSSGLLSESDASRWQLIRRLRNMVTHPTFQEIWSLRQACDVADSVAEAINALPWSGKASDG